MASNIKIIDLLSTLNKSELSDFQRYIQSPFFHKGILQDEMCALLNYIIQSQKMQSERDEIDFDRTEAFKKVYPGQNFVEKKIEKVLSALHQSLKNFIAYNAYQKPEFQFNRQLQYLTYLRDRGLHNRYKNLANSMDDEIGMLEYESIKNLKNAFDFSYERYNYEIQFNSKVAHLKFQEVLEGLEVSYLAVKLELLIQYLSVSFFSNIELSPEIDALIELSYFPETLIQKHPLLMLQYNLFLLFKSKEITRSGIEKVQQYFLECEKKIEREKVQQIATFLRNICVMGVVKDRNEFYPLLFQLSKEHYERGYLYFDGKITSSALISISQTALINREFDWCKHFIDEQKDKILNDTSDHDFYHLALANYYTYKGEFDQALALVPATMPTPDIHLLAKRIELKCYYETKSPLLDAKIDAFRMFLSRISKNTISEQLHQSNSNFLNILHQIHMSVPGDKKRNQKLLERIEEKSYLFEREWLVQKVNER
jgi:hypothetical protein